MVGKASNPGPGHTFNDPEADIWDHLADVAHAAFVWNQHHGEPDDVQSTQGLGCSLAEDGYTPSLLEAVGQSNAGYYPGQSHADMTLAMVGFRPISCVRGAKLKLLWG